MSPLLIILGLLIKILFYGSYVGYLQGISRQMNMSIHELGCWSENRFKELVETHLIYLARTLQDMEKEYPSYFPEVTRAKKNFQRAYDTFAQAGLIGDTGYKPYFRRK